MEGFLRKYCIEYSVYNKDRIHTKYVLKDTVTWFYDCGTYWRFTSNVRKKETQHYGYNGGPLYDNELICFVVKNRNVCNYNEYKSHKLRLIGVG